MFNHEPDNYECPFCALVKGGETELNKKSDIIFEDESVIVFVAPKWWKDNPGNVLVISREHIENVYDISNELLSKAYILGKQVALGMKEKYGCDGIAYRQHNEPSGGQDVWHFHLHVYPRWKDNDLYIDKNNVYYPTEEEKAPYAQKLRDYFNS